MAAAHTEPATPQHRRGLRSVWAAVGVSTTGDGAFAAALPLTAAAVTRDPTAVAAVSAVAIVPWLLVQPVAGALMDQWPYRTVLLTFDVARACIVGAAAVAVAFDVASIVLLAIAAAAMVAGQIFHDTAVHGVVPLLTGRSPAALDRANGRIYGAENAGRQLIGPPAGSMLFAWFAWVPFAVNAASFVVSAVLLARLPRDRPARTVRTPVLASARDGAVWLLRHRTLRGLALLTSAANTSYHLSWATFVLLATDQAGLGLTPSAFGFLFAAYAVGGVIGGPLTGWINRRIGAIPAALLVTSVHAVAWLAIGMFPSVVVAGCALPLVGLAQTVLTTVNASRRQVLVPPELLNRVTSAFRLLVNAPTPLSALLGGAIAAIWGLRAPLLGAAAVLLATVIMVGWAMRQARPR